ncbi:class I SAM-dependent methyltransferase [Salibacterium aidingense]|uniref:class I SAM-dependent methyltransferase n=1 Tax=Salibacterium aidingense TaxID=384933 RepID=UPI001E55EB0A|nr:class I SAM-dependent methyltransferase [Salibacterium aidingense]
MGGFKRHRQRTAAAQQLAGKILSAGDGLIPMTLPTVLTFVKEWMKRSLKDGDIAVDATAGNGKDTLYLAQCVGESGKVYSFDIQHEALEKTSRLLENHQLHQRVTLLNDGHENAALRIPENEHTKVKTVIFNLGYLPGGNKAITTRTETTLQAITLLLERMKSGALIMVVVYPGHQEGKREKEELEVYANGLPQQEVQVLRYEFINQVNDPPFLLIFEKR